MSAKIVMPVLPRHKTYIVYRTSSENTIKMLDTKNRIYGRFKENEKNCVMTYGFQITGNYNHRTITFYSQKNKIDIMVIVCLNYYMKSIKCVDNKGRMYCVSFGRHDYEVEFENSGKCIFKYSKKLISVNTKHPFYINRRDIVFEPRFSSFNELPIYHPDIAHFNAFLSDQEIRDLYDEYCEIEKTDKNLASQFDKTSNSSEYEDDPDDLEYNEPDISEGESPVKPIKKRIITKSKQKKAEIESDDESNKEEPFD